MSTPIQEQSVKNNSQKILHDAILKDVLTQETMSLYEMNDILQYEFIQELIAKANGKVHDVAYMEVLIDKIRTTKALIKECRDLLAEMQMNTAEIEKNK